MAVKTRNELKKYFSNGNVVREQYFSHLIDSTVNKADDRMHQSPDEGLNLIPSGAGNRFISFFRKSCAIAKNLPFFFIEMVTSRNPAIKNLSFSTIGADGKPVRVLSVLSIFSKKTLRSTNRVGVNTVSPAYTLDVNGTLATKCRAGTYKDLKIDPASVLADGEWYSILTGQTGFRCYEISASVESKEGCSALTGKILFVNGDYDSNILTVPKRGKLSTPDYRLELRWRKKNVGYDLQIRTHAGLRDKSVIKYNLTRIMI